MPGTTGCVGGSVVYNSTAAQPMATELQPSLQSDLPDLAGARLADLRAELGETATAALRRILAALDAGVEPVAGFQSAI